MILPISGYLCVHLLLLVRHNYKQNALISIYNVYKRKHVFYYVSIATPSYIIKAGYFVSLGLSYCDLYFFPMQID